MVKKLYEISHVPVSLWLTHKQQLIRENVFTILLRDCLSPSTSLINSTRVKRIIVIDGIGGRHEKK